MSVEVLYWASGREADPALTDKRPGWRPANLRKRRFHPATVIDVGAGAGTPPFYEAFPDAYRVLIEPLEEFEQNLKRHVADGRGEYVLAAAGEREGNTTIRVDPAGLFCSSMYQTTWRTPEVEEALEKRVVPLTTLDALYEARGWRPPFGLKVDTEGYEDRVIRGASRLLESTQFVIAEVSVSRRFHGSYSFADFIGLMDGHGFEACDFVDGLKAKDAEVSYVDVIFRRPLPSRR